MHQDRRHLPRYDVSFDVAYPVTGGCTTAKVLNASQGGLLVETDEVLVSGTLLTLFGNEAGDPMPSLGLRAEVVHAVPSPDDPHRRRMGLRILDPSPRADAWLRDRTTDAACDVQEAAANGDQYEGASQSAAHYRIRARIVAGRDEPKTREDDVLKVA